MNIILYKNSAPPNKVNKKGSLDKKTMRTIEDVRFIEKGALDILHPSVLVKLFTDIDDIRSYNYMKIGQFSRYYFIDSISTEGGLIRIDGRCDVLYSHMNDILNSTQYVLRQQHNNTSPYLEDNMLPISSKHWYKVDNFGRKVSDVTCGRVILATSGNGGTPI